MHKKLLTEEEEKIISAHLNSVEWKIMSKLIDNEIVNLFKQYPACETMDAKKGLDFTINELKRFKTTVKEIGRRVQRKGKDAKSEITKKEDNQDA